MAIFKCKMCGGSIEVSDGESVVTCDYCGSTQTVACADNEKKINLINRANNLRLKNEFDKALLNYQLLISDFPNESEAYWGICLCKYGIQYVDDYKNGKKIPTCHRTLFDSILKDSDYLAALKHADTKSKELYQNEAAEIDRIQKNIIKISQNEEPYDIFICYKETDENGQRTPDSVLAFEMYEKLTERGYKVFFARVSLEDKIGLEYEPVIFAALQSSKVMLALGTKMEYFNAVWVKNEWSRFISFMKEDKTKFIIPCYKNIDAYDMPEEFLVFQSQDMGKIGFIQDLIRGIDKIFDRKNSSQTIKREKKMTLKEILARIEISINDYDFKKGEWLIEEALALNPYCAEAYLFKLIIKRKLSSKQMLLESRQQVENEPEFIKALEYASEQFKEELLTYIETIKNNNLEDMYLKAKKLFVEKKYEEAKKIYIELANYKDSTYCVDKCIESINEQKYMLGIQEKQKKYYERAYRIFKELGEYKNATALAQEMYCEKIIAEQREKIEKAILILDRTQLEAALEKLMDIVYYNGVKDIIDASIAKFEKTKMLKKKQEFRKKAMLISACTIITLSIVICLLSVFIFIPSSKYDEAMQCLKTGKYDEAHEILSELNWKDSKEQVILINAQESLINNDYNTAIEYICSTGGIVNISYICDAGTFDRTHDYISSFDDFSLPNWSYNGYHLTEWDVVAYAINNQSPEYSANITLQASYDITTYTISLSESNENVIDKTLSCNIKQSISIENLSKKGYRFLGWLGANYETPVKDLVIPVGTYTDLHFVAQWELIDYSILYHEDGGVNNNPSNYNIEDHIILADGKKKGYTFLGWYTSDTFDVQITDIYNQTGDIVLYAKYSANPYTYTLDANGGMLTNPVKKITVTYDFMDGTKNEISLTTNQKIEFLSKYNGKNRLAGWYKDSEYYEQFNFDEVITEDITLYAKWEPISARFVGSITNMSIWSEGKYDFILDESCTFNLNYKKTEHVEYPLAGFASAYITIYVNGVQYGEEIYTTTSLETTKITANKGDLISINVRESTGILDSVTCYFCFSNVAKEIHESTATTYIPEQILYYEKTFIYDSNYSLPTPTRDGFTFEGWYYNGEKIEIEGTKWLNIDESTVIYAQWR